MTGAFLGTGLIEQQVSAVAGPNASVAKALREAPSIGRLATEMRLRTFAPTWPRILGWQQLDRLTEIARRATLEEELGNVERRLLFILDNVSYGIALQIIECLSAEGIAPMLDLLEATLVLDDSLDVVEEMVDCSPHLRDSVRADLGRGIGHLRRGEFDAAVPDLMFGFEGSLRDSVRARGHRKKMSNAQSAIMKIGFDRERELFLRSVYSGQANNARHGEECDRRALSLFTLVGLVCWYQELTGESALQWLGRRIEAEHRRGLPSPEG